MESQQTTASPHAQFRMSWVGYVRPVIVLLVMLALGLALTRLNGWVAAVAMALALGLFAVNVLTVRSLVLYTDDRGVWVYAGIFPWSRGVNGVKWRDLEDASYTTGFMSWALGSCTVRVGHRFTKTSEIVLHHIARGREAAMHINKRHALALSSRSIDLA